MSDRNDPSQFVFTAGPADGIAALPDTTPDDSQPQTHAEGSYATPLELIRHHDHADVPDFMHENPGRFFTQMPAAQRVVCVPRAFSPAGGPVVPGAGLLGGYSIAADASGPALLRFHDGYDSSAPVIANIALPVSASINYVPPTGIRYRAGLYVEIVTGIVSGVLYTLETEDVHPVPGGLVQ
jgi:hypothetical protein